MTAPILINTALQRGDENQTRTVSRFNGFQQTGSR